MPEGICDSNDDELSCPPTEEEIAKAINQLKNNKAPGADEITAELLKLGGGVMVQWLTQLSQLVWLREEVPVDWRTQLTIPLHKKGSYDDCDNFRGIALLSVPGKVFCRFLSEQNEGESQQDAEGESVRIPTRARMCRPAVLTSHIDGTCSGVSPTTLHMFCGYEESI